MSQQGVRSALRSQSGSHSGATEEALQRTPVSLLLLLSVAL